MILRLAITKPVPLSIRDPSRTLERPPGAGRVGRVRERPRKCLYDWGIDVALEIIRAAFVLSFDFGIIRR